MAVETSPHGSPPTEPTAPAEADATGGHRRGPFRPRRLISLRERQSGRDAAHGFRLADVVALLIGSIVVLEVVGDDSVLDLTVGRAAPVVVAALTTGRLLRSMGTYRFGRR